MDRAVAMAQSPVQSSLLTGHDTGVMRLVTHALTLIPNDSLEAGGLPCQYGNALYYQTGDYDGAMEALSQALVIARREGDAALEMRTLVAAGHAEASHLHFQESLKYDLQAIELASRVEKPFEETHPRQEVASVLHRTGDLEGRPPSCGGPVGCGRATAPPHPTVAGASGQYRRLLPRG